MIRLLSLVLLITIFVQESSWAMNVSGGRTLRRRGGNSNTAVDQKKQQEQEDKDAHARHIQEMPPEVAVPDLDASSFDKFVSDLGVTREQQDKIKESKKGIEVKAKELLKDQKATRSDFEKAKEAECPARAQLYLAARQACSSYNPNLAFTDELGNILTLAQREKLKALQAKLNH